MGEFELINGGIELINLVEPLWEKLNQYHGEHSSYFTNKYRNFTFEARKEKFTETNVLAVNVDLIKKSNLYVGYCVSTISKELCGEIDSIFINEEYRRIGLGDKLMTRAIKWLDRNKAKTKILSVAEGNDEVLEFYKKFGFYKRKIILEKIRK